MVFFKSNESKRTMDQKKGEGGGYGMPGCTAVACSTVSLGGGGGFTAEHRDVKL